MIFLIKLSKYDSLSFDKAGFIWHAEERISGVNMYGTNNADTNWF